MEKDNKKRNELLRALKYALIAASAGVIQIAVTTGFGVLVKWDKCPEFLRIEYWQYYLIGLVLSVLWNFTINRKFTFKSANNVPVAMLKVAAYYAVFTPLSTWLGNLFVDGKGWNETLVTVILMAINFITEFLYQRFFVFGKSIDTNNIAKKKNL